MTTSKSSIIKLLEHCYIKPQPTSSPPTTSLPLTFLDLPWLFFPPSKPLFFYQFPHPISHFTSTVLPKLKLSLSLTLQHFYPFAGTLILPNQPDKPHIVCSQNDAVSFTVSESNADFDHLSSNFQRDVTKFHPLVPELPSPFEALETKLPLLSIRVSIFPNAGFCIGFAYQHVVADGRTFNNFISTWALFCSSITLEDSSSPIKINPILPSYDRKVIVDSKGLEAIFLKEWWKRRSRSISTSIETTDSAVTEFVRATFSVSLSDMERIKRWILTQCSKKNEESFSLYLSPYVLASAFVWVCLVKAQSPYESYSGQDPVYFGFIAGGLTRIGYPVPPNYFGNCVGFGRSTATRGELLGEDGVLIAARAVGNTIKSLDKRIFSGADKWVSEWAVMLGSGEHVTVSGSPKMDLYARDFGWGRPKKIEEIDIEGRMGISFVESREAKGGIEVGLVLPKSKMDDFTILFNE
ncbi:hypothetical protein UlMin_033642 [Ulmus minor]